MATNNIVIDGNTDSWGGLSDTLPVRPKAAVDFSNETVVRICQPNSVAVQSSGVKVGHFYLVKQEYDVEESAFVRTNHDIGDTIVLLPVRIGESRNLFNEEGDKLLCSSKDGKWGKGEPGGQCVTAQGTAVCEFAKWMGNSPPPCKYSLDFAAFVPQAKAIVKVGFSGSNIQKGWDVVADVDKKGWLGVAYKVTLELIQKGKFAYYKMVLQEYDQPALAKIVELSHDAPKQLGGVENPAPALSAGTVIDFEDLPDIPGTVSVTVNESEIDAELDALLGNNTDEVKF